MKWKHKYPAEVDETAIRVARVLRTFISNKGSNVRQIERDLGMGRGFFSHKLRGESRMTINDLLAILWHLADDGDEFRKVLGQFLVYTFPDEFVTALKESPGSLTAALTSANIARELEQI